MYKKIRGLMAITLVAGTSTAFLAGGPAMATGSVNAAAAAAKPMTSDEVYSLYVNRSWIWSDGAGYFPSSKRAFQAWSGYGKNASYGEGRWFVKSNGSLCFNATWTSAEGAAPAVTCFEHRKDGNAIYQRRASGGDWYLFQTVPARRSNEIRKLKSGDYVSRRLQRIQKQIDRTG